MPQNVVSKGKLRQTDRRNVLKNIQISFMTIISHKFFVIQGNSTSQGYSKRYSSHYFLGGVGITHMIVCTFFTALVLLVRYVIHATNLSEVYKTQSNKLHILWIKLNQNKYYSQGVHYSLLYFQAYAISLMLSFTSGILAPSLVVWSSKDSRQQTCKVLGQLFNPITFPFKRYIYLIFFKQS